jgi:fucose permease
VTVAVTAQRNARVRLALGLLAFVSLGLPDGLIGVAWPAVRKSFDLPLDALGPLLVATTLGYVCSSAANGWLRRRLDLGALLALSCTVSATSLAIYAVTPTWRLMVGAGTLAGLGAGAIDAALNAHVATHHSPRTLNLLHAFYGLGTTAGPLWMTSILLASHSWQRGYAAVALAQLVLGGAFLVTVRVWPRRQWPEGRQADAAATGKSVALTDPAVYLGITAFFLYTGIESACGAWLYSLLLDGRATPMAAAGAAASIFWGGLMLSRLAFGWLADRWPLEVTVRRAITGLVLAAATLALDFDDAANLASIAVLGAACGPIFPMLMAATPRRLGSAASARVVGYQVAAATLGASILPATLGVVARYAGLEIVPASLALLSIALGLVCRRLSEL